MPTWPALAPARPSILMAMLLVLRVLLSITLRHSHTYAYLLGCACTPHNQSLRR